MSDQSPLEYPFDDTPGFGETRVVADGVKWLRMPLPFSLDHINLYLLDDGDGWVLIDTGLHTSMVRDLWDKVIANELDGKPIKRVVATHYHPDHIGCAGYLCKLLNVPLYMTYKEFHLARMIMADKRAAPPEEYLDFYRRAGMPEQGVQMMEEAGFGLFAKSVSDLPFGFHRISEGDELEIGNRTWRILIGSGHSPEHACLYCEQEHLLISGDQLLPKITANVSVYATEPMNNPLKAWIASQHMFKALPDETLVLPAHNDPFRGVKRRAEDVLGAHLRRLHALVAHCDEEPRSAAEGFPVLFRRKLKGADFVMALGESLAHMHYLENLGVLERIDSTPIRFKTVAKFDENIVLESETG